VPSELCTRIDSAGLRASPARAPRSSGQVLPPKSSRILSRSGLHWLLEGAMVGHGVEAVEGVGLLLPLVSGRQATFVYLLNTVQQ